MIWDFLIAEWRHAVVGIPGEPRTRVCTYVRTQRQQTYCYMPLCLEI